MEGAALLYNRLLAEASAAHFAAADTARVDRYGAALGQWAADMAADGDALAEWDQQDLWGRLMERLVLFMYLVRLVSCCLFLAKPAFILMSFWMIGRQMVIFPCPAGLREYPRSMLKPRLWMAPERSPSSSKSRYR